MTYKSKYSTHKTDRVVGAAYSGHGRVSDPSKWVTGPDLITRDKYYALLKHRAQARYRNESHSLTWEYWESIWENSLWLQRGRGADDLCLAQIDSDLGWHEDNVHIIPRRQHLKDKRLQETHRKNGQ